MMKNYELQIEALKKDFERLNQDFLSTLRSWAIWETVNGYPTMERSERLSIRVNGSHDAEAINCIRNNALVATIMGISRLIDARRNSRQQNRISIDRIWPLLEDSELRSYLVSELDSRGISKLTWVSGSDTLAHLEKIEEFLAPNSTNPRAIANLRKSIRSLRDGWIAHSLDNAERSTVHRNKIRDVLVTIGYILKSSQLVLLGRNTYPEETWKNSVQAAQRFWNIVAKSPQDFS